MDLMISSERNESVMLSSPFEFPSLQLEGEKGPVEPPLLTDLSVELGVLVAKFRFSRAKPSLSHSNSGRVTHASI